MPAHSPQYDFDFQRPEFPAYPSQMASGCYDPSFVLPLEQHHRVSVAPVNQAYQVSPKTHSYPHQTTHKRHVVRSSRSRRIPETSASSMRDISSSDETYVLDPLTTESAQQSCHQQKSKRRSDHTADDVEAERAWKSPRSSNDGGKEVPGKQRGNRRLAAKQDPRESAEHHASTREAAPGSEDVYSAEPEFIVPHPAAPLPI